MELQQAREEIEIKLPHGVRRMNCCSLQSQLSQAKEQ